MLVKTEFARKENIWHGWCTLNTYTKQIKYSTLYTDASEYEHMQLQLQFFF